MTVFDFSKARTCSFRTRKQNFLWTKKTEFTVDKENRALQKTSLDISKTRTCSFQITELCGQRKQNFLWDKKQQSPTEDSTWWPRLGSEPVSSTSWVQCLKQSAIPLPCACTNRAFCFQITISNTSVSMNTAFSPSTSQQSWTDYDERRWCCTLTEKKSSYVYLCVHMSTALSTMAFRFSSLIPRHTPSVKAGAYGQNNAHAHCTFLGTVTLQHWITHTRMHTHLCVHTHTHTHTA